MKWNPPFHIETEMVGCALPLKGYTHPTITAQDPSELHLRVGGWKIIRLTLFALWDTI